MKVSTLSRPMAEHFGRWLRTHREAAGMSLRNLSDAADCTHTAIAKIERGEFEPSPDLRARLAAALGATDTDATLATFPDRFSEAERPLLRQWLCDDGHTAAG